MLLEVYCLKSVTGVSVLRCSHECRQKLSVTDVVSIFLQLHAFVHLSTRKLLGLIVITSNVISFVLQGKHCICICLRLIVAVIDIVTVIPGNVRSVPVCGISKL